MKKTKLKNDLLIIIISIFVLSFSLILIGKYTKALYVYDDELRFYEIARNLYNGNWLYIQSNKVKFQKILYSLFLTPFFGINDVNLRIHIINVVSSFVIASSIVPIYLTCKKFNFDYRKKIVCVLLFATTPIVLFSTGFMSETLYCPLFLWLIYFWLFFKNKKFYYGLLVGFCLYILYLDKEISICVMLSIIFVDWFFLLIEKKVYHKRCSNVKKNIFWDISIIFSFSICFIISKLTFFKGLGNSYNQTSIQAINTFPKFIYMVYAFFYCLVGFTCSIFVLPIFLPLFEYKQLPKKSKELLLFCVLTMILLSITIAYTISVREDLFKVKPRLHLRYLGPVIILLFICCFTIKKIEVSQAKKYL